MRAFFFPNSRYTSEIYVVGRLSTTTRWIQSLSVTRILTRSHYRWGVRTIAHQRLPPATLPSAIQWSLSSLNKLDDRMFVVVAWVSRAR